MVQILILSADTALSGGLERLCCSCLPDADIRMMASVSEAAAWLERHDPALTLWDSALPDVDSIRLISELHMRGHTSLFALILHRAQEYVPLLLRGMRAGVPHVLFYPFSTEEVHALLICAAEQSASRPSTEAQLAKSIRSLRNTFVDRFLESASLPSSTITAMNAQYQVHLSNGIFRIAILRFPGLREEYGMGNCQMMLDTVVEELRELLDPLCFEMIPFIRDLNTIVLVLNYSTAQVLDSVLRQIPDLLRRNMERFFHFHMPYSAGVGHPEDDILYLRQALLSAQYAVRCQLLFGADQLFLYDDYQFERPSLESPAIREGFRSLASYAETLDARGASYAISQLTAVLTPNTDPAVITSLCEQIQITVTAALRKVSDVPELYAPQRELTAHLDTERSLGGLKAALSDQVQLQIEQVKTAKSKAMIRPIQEAKQYMEQNYAKRLTLSGIAGKINLSPSYFCTLFRQEVGVSFSDFLTGLRIEQAKKLLLRTSLDIASVSEQVGYQDPRYFSRVFFKAVGMQPSAYRNLHKHSGAGAGD